MKKYALSIIVLIIIILGVLIIAQNHKESGLTQSPKTATSSAQISAFDGKNSTFTIDNSVVVLTNGTSEVEAAPNSASEITTEYFGNEAVGDLNGDGRDDTAFLITQNSGGSGTYFYVVVALKTDDGYKTTNAFLIGDRIAPQTTSINSGAQELYVNFAERKPGEPMTAQPSQSATLVLKVNGQGVLQEVMK